MKHKSHPVSKHSKETSRALDARIQRTRISIDRAFVELLYQRTYRSLTVRDIAGKAGVGRATFYAHYASKDELLRSQLIRIIMPLVRECPGGACLVDCTLLFEHVRSAPRLFRNIMSGGEGSGSRVVRRELEDRMAGLLRDRGRTSSDLPDLLVTRFAVSTLMAVIGHSLQSNAAESGEQMQRQFARLAGSGLGEELE